MNSSGTETRTLDGRDLTIIIVTFRSERFIGACLEQLVYSPSQQSRNVSNHKGLQNLEIIVVDNGSDDSTTAIVRSVAPGALLLEAGENLGYAAAINRARMAATPGNHLLILNPDIVFSLEGISILLDALHEGSDQTTGRVGIIVPKLVDVNGSTQPSIRRYPTILRAIGEAVLGGNRAGHYERLGERVLDQKQYETAREISWASGAALLVANRCANDIGDWDETFFLYSEETDFFLRAFDRGWLVRFIPDAAATHVGGDLHSSPLLWSLLVANRVRLCRKRHGVMRAYGLTLALAVNELLRITTENGTHKAGLLMLLRPARREFAIQKLRNVTVRPVPVVQ